MPDPTDKKVTELSELTAPAGEDLLMAVDISDDTDDPDGTSKKLEIRNLFRNSPLYFNIAFYGAVGDGVTDDTTAIQAAIDDCVAAGGGTVLVPTGDFLHTAPLVWSEFINLQGMNITASKLISTHTGNGIVGTDVAKASIRDITIQNTNGSNTGAGYLDDSGVFLDFRCVDFHGFKYNVKLDQTQLATFDLCHFNVPITAGLWCVGTGTNRIDIHHSQFNANATGVAIIHDGGTSFNCCFNNFNGWDVHMYLCNVRVAVIEGNEHEGSASDIIQISDETFAGGASTAPHILNFMGNHFETSGGHAIEILSAQYLTIIGNWFVASGSNPHVNGLENAGIVHIGPNVTESGQLTDAQSGGLFYTQRSFISGEGTPEGAVTANKGSIYQRTDGGAGTGLYVKESGTATNTGWVAK